MLIAESTPEAKAFLEWWVVAVFIAQGVLAVGQVVLMFRNQKQKREVNFAFEPASKTEFEKLVEQNRREHENLFSKIGGVERGGSAAMDRLRDEIAQMERRVLADSSQRGEKIHTRINEVLSAVSEVRGELKQALKSQ